MVVACNDDSIRSFKATCTDHAGAWKTCQNSVCSFMRKFASNTSPWNHECHDELTRSASTRPRWPDLAIKENGINSEKLVGFLHSSDNFDHEQLCNPLGSVGVLADTRTETRTDLLSVM